MRQVTLEQYLELILNLEKARSPNHKELRVVESEGSTRVWYSKVSMPLMSDRDSLIKTAFTRQADGSALYTASSVERPDFPEVPGVIRMRVFKLGCAKADAGDLRIVEFASFSMGGYFPMKILNYVMASMLDKQMVELVKRLRELKGDSI